MRLRVTADGAIRALGIKTPVSFVMARLNDGENLDDYAQMDRWQVAGVSPYRPGIIRWDPYAGIMSDERGGQSLEECLAHELVHVRQHEKIGDPDEADRLYKRENAIRGYDANRFEVEARRLAPLLARYVKVEVC